MMKRTIQPRLSVHKDEGAVHAFMKATTDPGLVRNETLKGETYLVFPVVMMSVGVSNRILYTAEELADRPGKWDGTTLTIRHPEENGQPIFANEPATFEKYGVGQLFNTHYDAKAGKLRSEAWMNVAQAEAIEPGLPANFQSGFVIDVSIGVVQLEEAAEEGAEFEGSEYKKIAHAVTPDHLALLPDQTGACKDAKAPCIHVDLATMSEEDRKVLERARELGVRVFEISYNEIERALDSAVSEVEPGYYVYVRDVDDSYFVYELYPKGENPSEPPRNFRRSYQKTAGGNGVTLSEDSEEIEIIRKVEYRPVNNNKKEVHAMTPDKLIAHAQTNFTEADREWLSQQSQETLDKLAPKAVEPSTHAAEGEGAPAPTPAPAAPAPTINASHLASAVAGQLRQEFGSIVDDRLSAHSKQPTVDALHEKIGMKKELLSQMSEEELNKLADQVGVANYAGKGAGQTSTHAGGADDEFSAPEMPPVVMAKAN